MNQMINLKHNFYFYLIETCFHLLDSILWYYDNENFQWSPAEIFSVFFSQEISQCWLSIPIWNTNSPLSNARVS